MAVMAGFVHFYFTAKAKEFISPFFVNVCYNFTPFISQCVTFILGAQDMPGWLTVYGGASLFVGCTLLFMNYQDQREMAMIPWIGTIEKDEYKPEIMSQKSEHE